MLLNAEASAALTFVTLSGAWAADQALYIPRQTVIALADGAELAATAQLAAAGAPGSVVFANGSYSALVAPGGLAGGARVACGGLPVRGVFALGAGGFVLDGVTVEDCGGSAANCSAAVHFVGAPLSSVAEVARTRVVGGCRGIWLQTFGRIVIHHSEVINSTKFGVDWDSYSGPGLVWANTISGSGYDAVFIEQGAVYVTVVDNIISNSGAGVAVYPYEWAASPTANHVVAGNNVTGGCTYAFSTGSTKGGSGNTTWLPASYVTYVGNTIGASNRVGFHANGPQKGIVFLSNDDAVGFDAPAMAMAGSAVAIDPLGRSQLHSSASKTPTPSPSPSRSTTRSPSPSPTLTLVPNATASPSPSDTASSTPAPTNATVSESATATPSPSGTAPAAASPSSTVTAPAAAAASPSGAALAAASASAAPVAAPSLSPLPSPPAACVAAVAAAAAAAAASAGAAACPPTAAALAGIGLGGLALGFALGVLALWRRGGAAAGKPLLASSSSATEAASTTLPLAPAAAKAGAATAVTVNPLATQRALAPAAAVRWVRVYEEGVLFCEREDGTGERVWEEDLPPGAVLVD